VNRSSAESSGSEKDSSSSGTPQGIDPGVLTDETSWDGVLNAGHWGLYMSSLALFTCLVFSEFGNAGGAIRWPSAVFFGPVFVVWDLLQATPRPPGGIAIAVALGLYPTYAAVLRIARSRGVGRLAFCSILIAHHLSCTVYYCLEGWGHLKERVSSLQATGSYAVLTLFGAFHLVGFWYTRSDPAVDASRLQFKLRDLLLVMLVLALALGLASWRNSGL